jgi:hypothetical protein
LDAPSHRGGDRFLVGGDPLLERPLGIGLDRVCRFQPLELFRKLGDRRLRLVRSSLLPAGEDLLEVVADPFSSTR